MTSELEDLLAEAMREHNASLAKPDLVLERATARLGRRRHMTRTLTCSAVLA
jgi:hypothetical protein